MYKQEMLFLLKMGMALRPLGELMSLARTTRKEKKNEVRSSLNLVEEKTLRSGEASLAKSAY